MANKPDTQHLGLRNYQHPDKFGEWLGYTVASIDTEAHTAQVELEIREDHLSPAGKVHGGVVSAFFDFACGAAVFSTLEPNDFCSTVELKVNYFHPIHRGDHLVAKTEVVFRGKKLCVVHGRLYRSNPDAARGGTGALAMVTATFNVVTPRPATPGTTAPTKTPAAPPAGS